MTRDEALREFQKWECTGKHRIDLYVTLGMLKLDEPKSAWDRFLDVFAAGDYDDDDSNPETIVYDIKKALAKAGLKIVEK